MRRHHPPPPRRYLHGESPIRGRAHHSGLRPCHYRRLGGLALSAFSRPPDDDGRAGPCSGIARSDGIGSRSSASRMKVRSDTTSSWVWRSLPVASSCAARAASRTCSSVPSRMMSDKAASTASRTRRARSEPGESATLRSEGTIEAIAGAAATPTQVTTESGIDAQVACERPAQRLIGGDQGAQTLVDLAIYSLPALLNRDHRKQADTDADQSNDCKAQKGGDECLRRAEI